ncbi:MAG: AAA family ATPase [Planctomycetota bacterium]|jgi:MoxR-like ATPase
MAVTSFDSLSEKFSQLRTGIGRIILGQEKAVYALCVSIFSGGHVLIEGVPGTAKTLMVRTLALLMGGRFKRIQFTPDLMPADIIGTRVYNLKENVFEMQLGPIFTDFLLADEINRTPPKTQSALLECMQEMAVTLDGTRHQISPVFTVFATQNPIEQEGTYPLPEAQSDRFMMKVVIDYPSPEAEDRILQAYNQGISLHEPESLQLEPVLSIEDVIGIRKIVRAVRVEKGILEYIRRIVAETRTDESVRLGASPRAAISLLLASKALAALNGRDFVIPDDVKMMTPPVLRHRIIFKPEAEIEGITAKELLEKILTGLEVPR